VKDFITRMAERALGTAPRVDPQATSRYAPARLPLPELPLPDPIAAAAHDLAPTAPLRKSYDEQPARRPFSRRPNLNRLTDDTVAEGADNLPASPMDRSPEERARVVPPLDLRGGSTAKRSLPPNSVAQQISIDSPMGSTEDREATHHYRPSIPESHFVDASTITATFEASPIRDDAGNPFAESGLFQSQNPIQRNSGNVAVPAKTAALGAEDEPPAVSPVSITAVKDRDIEPEMKVEADSSRPPNGPPEISVADDGQTITAADYLETRAISAASVRPAIGKVNHFIHEREAQDKPSIRVTIGRVEVRTAPPPVVVEPVAPPAPELSLAEFLRQHNERRR
jgi:hypothetical protein